MENEPNKINLTIEEFHGLKGTLKAQITAQLETEILCQSFEEDDDVDHDSDLWDTPAVDSKTIIKLSPLVEKLTGKKIKPEWIKPGGYDSTDDAVGHLVHQLELSFEQDEAEKNA